MNTPILQLAFHPKKLSSEIPLKPVISGGNRGKQGDDITSKIPSACWVHFLMMNVPKASNMPVKDNSRHSQA